MLMLIPTIGSIIFKESVMPLTHLISHKTSSRLLSVFLQDARESLFALGDETLGGDVLTLQVC